MTKKILTNNMHLNTTLLPEGSRIILGLSGGPDSLYLLHSLASLLEQGKISYLLAAHLDHEWRTNSAADVAFCQKACESLGIPFVSKKLSQLDISLSGSKEEMGRTARRFFLEKVRIEHNADLIALGHHAQDQEETFFIRLIRGAGLSGLCAMRPINGVYIRPLLTLNKHEIVSWLDNNGISYLIDSTNESDSFLRNRIRKTVLPALQECDSRFSQNFLQTLHRLQETESYLEDLTQNLFTLMTHTDKGCHTVSLDQFLKQPRVMQYRLLMHWLCIANVPFPPSHSFLDEIIRFLQQPGSKEHALHESWKIVKKKNQAWIAQ